MSKLDELFDRVCAKLEQELEDKPVMAPVATYLRERARSNAEECLALMDASKTLSGAYEAMEKAARAEYERNRQVRGVCFGEEQAYAIVNGYYGLTAAQTDARAEKPQTSSKVVSLFDML